MTIERPEGIIVTLPKRFFKEYGIRKFLHDLDRMTMDSAAIWHLVMKSVPIQDVAYVYVICFNRIHHRAMLAGIERDQNYVFCGPDGKTREFTHVNAILLSGPVVFAPHRMPMRGFQGFRYCNKLF